MSERFPNILTIDIEDWFHILDADGGYTRRDWGSLPSRVERNTERLLAIVDEAGAVATCFVVGWVARRFPTLVRRISEAGHELASHSYWHEVIPCHTRDTLAQDLGHSRELLEDLSGRKVEGFRAPGGSLTPGCAWAFDVLLEQGYRYDSSLSPGYSSHGGYPSPFTSPHRIRCENGELFEIPTSTVDLGLRRIAYAGGGYLRLFPYALVAACIRRDNRAAVPANIYLHPREIDPDQPRMELSWMRSFKYYVGLESAEAKIRRLLRDHRFVSIEAYLADCGEALSDRVLDVRAEARAAEPAPDPDLVPPPPASDAVPAGVAPAI